MRKSTTPEDLLDDSIPKLIYDEQNRCLKEWEGEYLVGYTWHHTIKQQVLERQPELRKHLKLILLPTFFNKKGNMHAEADNRHSKFEERWGVSIDEVMEDLELLSND